MKPAELDYAAPASLDEALGLLADDPSAKILAGGQSLVPLLNLRLAAPSLLVDLRRIPGLDEIQLRNGDLVLGAMARQRQVERHVDVSSTSPLLGTALRHIGHPQIRSQGTIGGSLAHADPAAELPAVVVALDGRIRALGPAGERVIEAESFFTGFLSTALADEEIITAVALPLPPPRTGAGCVEIAQRSGDYALCGAVAQVTLDRFERVAGSRVALFGVADRPVRARAVEAALAGEVARPEAVAGASREASNGFSPTDDARLPADYRLHLARVMTRRALEKAARQAAR